LIIQITESTTQPTTIFLLRTLKTQTLFENNCNFGKKSTTSSLLESTNLTPLHQGGLPLQLLISGLPLQLLTDPHHLLLQQSVGLLKPSVPVN